MNPKINNLKLAKTHDYCASGEAKLAAIFLHGIASDSSTFGKALEYLEKSKKMEDVRFITLDLLGSGKSYKSDELNYDYKDQLTALHNSIQELGLNIPLVLVGHSMGTLIATRYATKYKDSVRELILISPPIYTEEDLENPAFKAGMKVFREAVSVKNRKILGEKSFNNSMEKIVNNKKNYATLASLEIPAVLIYGAQDQFIGSYNIPKLSKENPDRFTAIKTEGRHGVSRDKYTELLKVLEGVLSEVS